MRGTWVGALCSWCHCPLESGGTLPLQGGAAQPPRQTPRMAGVATAHPLLLENSRGNQHGKTKEERGGGGSKPQKDKPDAPPRGSWNVTPTTWKNSQEKAGLRGALACWHSGLWAVAQVRVCSSQTRNLSLSFSELLVATHGVQALERPGKPNSSRHAMIPATTEACIIASAGLATLSQATLSCLLSLVPGSPV